MNEQNRKKTNIIYAAIGVMTLIIATIGATFAYYTATSSVNTEIKGNMATVTFAIDVTKKSTADTTKGGLIPMTNSMIEKAVSNASTKGVCVDDNGNAVCQIYKITIRNTGTVSMLVDGYVTLTGGSGTSKDYTTATTTMRWAQVSCTETSGTLGTCTTAMKSTSRASTTSSTKGIDSAWDALGSDGNSIHNTGEIKDTKTAVAASAKINGNPYDIIKQNYIRVSKHTANATYTQANDVTSALVYNQYLDANDKTDGNNATNTYGDSSTTYTDSQTFYIAVWLTETGENQTAGSGGTNVPTSTANFFSGIVTFISAQGSEVSAAFVGYEAVKADTEDTQ